MLQTRHFLLLNTWNATDRTLSFKVWGVLGFGFWGFRGFGGFGVGLIAFVLLEHMECYRQDTFFLRFGGIWGFRGCGVGLIAVVLLEHMECYRQDTFF